jgi:hypothetical protein
VQPRKFDTVTNERTMPLNHVHESYAHAVIAARILDAEQRRAGHRLVRARRLSRKAARASIRAQRLSRQAALAQRQARVVSARVT